VTVRESNLRTAYGSHDEALMAANATDA